MPPYVYAIGTMDSKGFELAFVRDRLIAAGVQVRTIDVGTLGPPTTEPDVRREEVLQVSGLAHELENTNDRGQAVAIMAQALREYLLVEMSVGNVAGVLGIGGSGGTSLITTAMRALPIGLPKFMVSTVASGNVAAYVDSSDIAMMYSVVDVAGLNTVSTAVLANAANAMAGMVSNPKPPATTRRAIGMTMFGVTTPCVTRVREILEARGFDCLVFHATGSGGRAMEQLVASGLISGVLDVTTTEVADEVAGGVFTAGPQRFDKLIQAQIPLVVSLGAMDMVNFGGMETVPSQFANRKLHVHNAQVTLMRTSIDENRKIARFIAEKLNRATSPWRLLVPEGGVSLLDISGKPFFDPEADHALFDELEQRLDLSPGRQLIRLPYDINAPEFAEALADNFLQMLPNSDLCG
ncbi:MAG: Tm-1-like ATP-binding domain-containing protein [Planctomycetaceae bacterium]|nr:Tm-1-like ATP-binding domain-containing protein [Planctomycetaceae bacterium]